MRLSPPKFLTWLVALALAVVGVLAKLAADGTIQLSVQGLDKITPFAFWLPVASVVLLLLATLLRGL